MKLPQSGAIDCDIHPGQPGMDELVPFLPDYWRDQFENRHIDRMAFTMTSYPPNSPLSGRPDWRTADGKPGGGLDLIRKNLLDPFKLRFAICNMLHGAIALYNEDMSAAICSAVNDWTAKNLLDPEPRLRASILLPMHNPATAVAEIERLAHDRRFVQVLLPVMGDALLGKRIYWPVYKAAERHGLPVCIHAGSTYRWAPTPSGWPAHRVEDYVVQSAAFENQVVSFLAEGVFHEYPKLKLVLAEAGFTWLPNLLWRTAKEWRGVRAEVPWIDRNPAEIVEDHVRLTLQPVDAPKEDPAVLARLLDHLGSDRFLLFSTDYPHWQFDGEDALPEGWPAASLGNLLKNNALDTYPRLREASDLRDNAGHDPKNEEQVP
jgi:predicted TIM-barrel fold metal-dependent hydrolase